MFAVFLGIFALVTVAAFCYFFGIWISYLGLLAGEALVWILKRVGVPLSDMASVLIVIPIVDFGVRHPQFTFSADGTHRPPLYCKEKTQKKVNCVQVGHNPVNPVGRWIRLL